MKDTIISLNIILVAIFILPAILTMLLTVFVLKIITSSLRGLIFIFTIGDRT